MLQQALPPSKVLDERTLPCPLPASDGPRQCLVGLWVHRPASASVCKGFVAGMRLCAPHPLLTKALSTGPQPRTEPVQLHLN